MFEYGFNHRQWTSFLAGASTAVYVYMYSFYYFFFKTKYDFVLFCLKLYLFNYAVSLF